MTNVTQILSEIEFRDPAAAERLLQLVYDELRKLTAAKLANEQPGRAGRGAQNPISVEELIATQRKTNKLTMLLASQI